MSKILHVNTSAYRAVVIGDPCQPPTPESVALAINTTDKGFLAPRLTALQIAAITDPVVGLLVFDLDNTAFKYYDGADWVPIGTGSAAGPTGPTGPQGEIGRDGRDGRDGLQGTQGIQGPEGPIGRDGRDGLTGQQGPTGPQGIAGSDANLQLYKENGAPSVPPIAAGAVSIALGDGALTQAHGQIAHSAGSFTNSGDAQAAAYVMRGITSDNAYTEIFLNGTSDKLLIGTNMTVAFSITLIARRTDVDGEGAVFELRGGIDRAATVLSTRLLGGVNKTIISKDNQPWDVLAEADTFTGALRVKVRGETGKNIRWVAHIRTVEVIN